MKIAFVIFALLSASTAAVSAAPGSSEPIATVPDAVVDLRTRAGVELVKAQWRYSDASIVEVVHREPGPDLKATGTPNRTHDMAPKAGAADFDDGRWEVLDPTHLEQRRGHGRLSFNWYRINVTIPEKVGSFATAGSTAVFEVVLDDYSEVWADGKLAEVLGQSGGGMIRGWNAPNRVVVGRDVKPGQRIQIAIFGANGPLSAPPANFVWIRSATLDFYKPGRAEPGEVVPTEIVRVGPALDDVISPSAKIEHLATGFAFTEGPVWKDDYLLFSDPNNNVIHRWTRDGQVSVFRTHSGYTGDDITDYHQPGSNGLAVDRDGRLTICEHGNRRVTRIEKNGVLTVLADRFDGKRLNSPNDLVYRSDGALFFTDPPFGLPKTYDDPAKELPFSGVFCLMGGALKLVSTDLKGPNGLAFSPDEKYLYVTNWDERKKVVMRYDVARDGTLANGTVFFDMTAATGEEALDGVKVDRAGNLFVSGPGGLWIISPSGKHLGTIRGPELPANMAWGGDGGRTLYLTARRGLYRLHTLTGTSP
jgi:gluconolactonase